MFKKIIVPATNSVKGKCELAVADKRHGPGLGGWW
jgi:hypothetical protein